MEEKEGEKEGVVADGRPPRDVRVTGVVLRVVGGSLDVKREVGKELEVRCGARRKLCCVQFHRGGDLVYEAEVHSTSQVYSAESNVLLIRVTEGSAVATFASDTDAACVLDYINKELSEGSKVKSSSIFNLRTEEASAKQYFQFYGYLSQQQNMMQDYVRTSTFQTAILQNLVDFKEKVVLDVGAGTGVLSFFALQGGARKVYAVEASNMSAHCSKLVKANNFSDRMTVIAGKIEEIDLPEEVDVIISEPMGYMLFNERMLETYLHAKKWLKPGGKMFPTQGILYVSPFTDEALYLEQMGKSYFWQQRSFHGVDVSVLHAEAVDEYFRQPIVDTFDLRILMSRPIGHMTDFATAHERELHKIDIPLTFKSWTTGYMHGLAFWFDVSFIGAQTTVWLSTAPFQPLTHWYQVRLLLRQPLYVQEGQEISGMVHMVANERQSYDITATVKVVATDVQSTGTYDLKNPNFRYMSAAQVPPGSLHTNPTETFFDSQMVGGGEQQPHTASLQQVPIQQPHPQIIRSSSGQVGHLNQQHSMGELQTGTEVIPVINGSIISPSVHQQTPQGVIPLAQQALTSYSPSPAYGHYSQPRQASVGRQGQHWGGSLQPVQTVSHSAAHQHGMGVGGLVDLGTGTVQHGVGTFQYGMGVAQHAHTNQHVISSPPNENVLYQKWSSQQQPTVLQAVASRS